MRAALSYLVLAADLHLVELREAVRVALDTGRLTGQGQEHGLEGEGKASPAGCSAELWRRKVRPVRAVRDTMVAVAEFSAKA